MNRKIYYILILIAIILFIGMCLLDEEEKIPLLEKELPAPQKTAYYNDSCIVILNKNWEKGQLDSIIAIIDGKIPVFYSGDDALVFISQNKDTIIYHRSQINSENPLFIFTPEMGSHFTSAKHFPSLFDFYFPHYITSEESDIASGITSIAIDTVSQELFQERTEINRIVSKKYYSLLIEKRKRLIPIKANLPLANRNLHYPLLNGNQYLSIRFDNDFWDYTDYYYTNGLALGYSHPVFVSSPISRLLISNVNSGIDYYGIQLVQHIYTGLKPKVDSIVEGDRPWSAYSTLGQNLVSYDIRNKLQHYSEFNIGLLGPESGGGFLQDFVHVILPNNSAPKGWENQIATDIIIDYKYSLKKLFYESKQFESYTVASGQIGTLRDNVSWGFGLKYGKFIPFYMDKSIYKRKRMDAPFEKKLRYHLVFNIESKLIGYDATLQGGLFNKKSVYVLPSGAINRFVIESYIGFELSYGIIDLQFLQFWKSREFHTGEDHKYASVRLNIAF